MKALLLIAILCLISSSVMAAKPDWAAKGKPDRDDIEAMAEQMKDSKSRREILDRGKPVKGKKDKDHNDDYDEELECELTKEECAAIRAERNAQHMAEKEARKAEKIAEKEAREAERGSCLLYTSPSPRDQRGSRMPSSA